MRVWAMLGVLLLPQTCPAAAAVSVADASRLGTTLTLLGAERSGNREGTIPPYTGGLSAGTSPPGFSSGSGRWTDPFAGEKPLYAITGRNMASFAEKLSETSRELLRRYPGYRMDIYPTHRSVAYPAWALENTVANATRATLAKNGLALRGAFGGIPFPIPRSGNEVMWNHMLVYNGYPAEYRGRNWYVDPAGKAVNSGTLRCSLRSSYYAPEGNVAALEKGGNAFFEAAYDFLEPPVAAGNAAYCIDTLDPVEQPRRAWSYAAATGLVRPVLDLAYDTPIASQGGITTYDEGYLFLGTLDFFDYRLLGKREMFIPYNNYRMVFQSEARQLLTPGHLNPNLVRWELHRVWVVEARRKPGKRHSLARRLFYFDEDWGGAGMSDGFDGADRPVKGIFLGATPLYDVQIPMARCYWAYDLVGAGYSLIQHFGDPGMGYRLVPGGFPEQTFAPEALPKRGR